jgi:two-component system invasion response regulator UvrY
LTRVLLVDDHPVIRQGIRRILTGTFADLNVSEADSGEQALALAEAGPWDLMLLDLSLPGVHGLEVIHQVRQAQPGIRIIVVSVHPAHQVARRAISAGAMAYIDKSATPEEMVKAVAEVLAGRTYVTATAADPARAQRSAGLPHELLSDREYQVLRMLGAGKTVSEIASELALSVKTISTYRSRILEKMGLRTTPELMRYVIDHGLVP